MVTLVRVDKTDENILHNVMQYYIYEFSNYMPIIKLEENGTYKPFDLEEYWIESNKHPFLIKTEDEICGFALVESATKEQPNSIKEFFIMSKFKGKGIGKLAAVELFNKFPGEWEVIQIHSNYPAQAFWRSVITKYTNGCFTESYTENRKLVQRFVSC